MYDSISGFYGIELGTLAFFDLSIVFTVGKIIGYTGMLLFGGRWLVQVWVSRKHKRPVVPRLFWYMSISGSLLLLSYFIFGKNDSVGILSNLLPLSVAFYNLYLELTHQRTMLPPDPEGPQQAEEDHSTGSA
jgi:lipid-A-disaccharide synthase-like uncharacterized protein